MKCGQDGIVLYWIVLNWYLFVGVRIRDEELKWRSGGDIVGDVRIVVDWSPIESFNFACVEKLPGRLRTEYQSWIRFICFWLFNNSFDSEWIAFVHAEQPINLFEWIYQNYIWCLGKCWVKWRWLNDRQKRVQLSCLSSILASRWIVLSRIDSRSMSHWIQTSVGRPPGKSRMPVPSFLESGRWWPMLWRIQQG